MRVRVGGEGDNALRFVVNQGGAKSQVWVSLCPVIPCKSQRKRG